MRLPDGFTRPLASGLFTLAVAGALMGCEPGHGEEVPAGRTAPRVALVSDTLAERVDVLVDGEPFTAYLYTDSLPVLKKPVLYPLRTATGTAITRAYPLERRPGERVDHPHHIGLWFNYGDVNGLDFWNNSDAIPADRAPHMGTIRHREIRHMEDGAGRAVLDVTADWLAPDGRALLREDTRFVFLAEAGLRGVDRITTLTALDERVAMPDNKEGVLGLRVTRALEHPADRPELFTDASGQPTEVPVLDNTGVTGYYWSSEGIEGEDVWGTRGRWVALSGVVDGDSVTVVMMDHPQNPGYPTYWHARGYGLFAANPLGQKALSDGADELNFALEPGASATFRHRVLLLPGEPDAGAVEARHQAFVSEVP